MQAIDKYSNVVIGAGAIAKESENNGAIALGNFSESTGRNSIAIGSANGEVEGVTKATGDFAIAIGTAVEASTVNGLGEVKIGSEQYNHYYYDGGTGWKIGSDVRDKINITPIPRALDFINSIEPIRFRYNYRRSYSKYNSLLMYDKEEHAKATKAETKFNYGVKAQEVADALQSIYGSEAYGQIVFKQEKASLEGIEDCYTINMTNFIPFLIGAIREQQQQIDVLQQRVNELEAKINE
jgi:hypothetical protein